MKNTNLVVRPYQEQDEKQVIDLWHCCGLVVPWNDPKKDILLKLQVQPELFFIGLIGTQVVATIMAGYEGHRGWLNYLAVAPEYQRQGIGQYMVEQATTKLKAMSCPKINLLILISCTILNKGRVGTAHQRKIRPDRSMVGDAHPTEIALLQLVQDVMIRTSNTNVIKFYEHLGFKIDDVIGMGKRL